jgi:hypothetical protein
MVVAVPAFTGGPVLLVVVSVTAVAGRRGRRRASRQQGNHCNGDDDLLVNTQSL